MLFKDLLQSVVNQRNLTFKDVETLTGIKSTIIQQYFNGKIPSEKDADILCKTLNINQDDITYDEYNISVNEARIMMQCSPEFVKQNIRNGRLPGCWSEGVKRDNFHIPRKAFMKYLEEWNKDTSILKEVYELRKAIKALGSALLEMIGYAEEIKKMSHPTTNDDATKR